MDGFHFDDFTRSLSTTTSRRQALKLLAGAGVGSVMTLVGARGASAEPGRCRTEGTVCREHTECCSGFCDPRTLRCACSPGSNVCPSTGACVEPCGPNEVFNPTTCQCECPGAVCGGVCCAAGQICTDFGQCCANPTFCRTTDECCPGFFCSGGGKGSGTCRPCAGLMCKAGAECCPGYVCVAGTCIPQF